MPKVLAKSPSFVVEASLTNAERKGFRPAVIARTCALVPIALFHLPVYGYPNNIYIAGLILAAATAGLAPALVGSVYSRSADATARSTHFRSAVACRIIRRLVLRRQVTGRRGNRPRSPSGSSRRVASALFAVLASSG